MFEKTENILIKGFITKVCPGWFLERVYARIIPIPYSDKTHVFLSFDIDYEEDVKALPWILDRLDEYGMKASFAVIGVLVQLFPEEHKEIVRRGHEIMNHTMLHPHHEVFCPGVSMHELSEEQLVGEIVSCHNVCVSRLGVAPVGFRLPHFGNPSVRKGMDWPHLYGLLKRLDYKYSSSVIGMKVGVVPQKMFESIVEFPLSACPRHPFGVLDTYHSYGGGGGPVRPTCKACHKGHFHDLFVELFCLVARTHKFLNVYMDPQDVFKNDEFINILQLLQNEGAVVKTYKEAL